MYQKDKDVAEVRFLEALRGAEDCPRLLQHHILSVLGKSLKGSLTLSTPFTGKMPASQDSGNQGKLQSK
jgi:hypothetical protein